MTSTTNQTITVAGTATAIAQGSQITSYTGFTPEPGEYGYIEIAETNSMDSATGGGSTRTGNLVATQRVEYEVKPGGVIELDAKDEVATYSTTDSGRVTDLQGARVELYASGSSILAKVNDDTSYNGAGQSTPTFQDEAAVSTNNDAASGTPGVELAYSILNLSSYSGGGTIYVRVYFANLPAYREFKEVCVIADDLSLTSHTPTERGGAFAYGAYDIQVVGGVLKCLWTPNNPAGTLKADVMAENLPNWPESTLLDDFTGSQKNGISAALTIYRNTDYPYDVFPTNNYINKTYGRCLRFAAKENQGQGFSEFTGDDWIWPEIYMETLKIFNEDNEPVNIIWDEVSGLPFQLDVRTAPTGSAIVDSFADKKNSGSAGTEIPSVIKFVEHVAGRESMLIEHLDTHIRIRPWDETNKDDTGYDSNGFRTAFEMDINGYEDGEETATRESVDIPDNGIVSFQGLLEANRIQLELETTTSEYRIIGQTTDYLEKDTGGSDSKATTTEMTTQQDYYNKAVWLSKYYAPTLNLASGITASGAYNSLGAGPDGDSYAIVMSGETGLTTESVSLSGDFSLQLWIYGIVAASTVLLKIGTTNVLTLGLAAGVYTLTFTDGVNTVNQTLTWDGTGWDMITVSRDGTNLTIYEGN